MWFTWANLLTGARLAAVAPCAWAVLTDRWPLAAALFAVAVVTDLADGPIARRLGEASPVGGLLDHATDALFVAVILGCLAASGLVNAWLAPMVALAFVQYLLDSRALSGAELKTSMLGRYNGVAYFVLVGIPVIRNGLGWSWPPDGWIQALGWLLLATTVTSMADRALALLRR